MRSFTVTVAEAVALVNLPNEVHTSSGQNQDRREAKKMIDRIRVAGTNQFVAVLLGFIIG